MSSRNLYYEQIQKETLSKITFVPSGWSQQAIFQNPQTLRIFWNSGGKYSKKLETFSNPVRKWSKNLTFFDGNTSGIENFLNSRQKISQKSENFWNLEENRLDQKFLFARYSENVIVFRKESSNFFTRSNLSKLVQNYFSR